MWLTKDELDQGAEEYVRVMQQVIQRNHDEKYGSNNFVVSISLRSWGVSQDGLIFTVDNLRTRDFEVTWEQVDFAYTGDEVWTWNEYDIAKELE